LPNTPPHATKARQAVSFGDAGPNLGPTEAFAMQAKEGKPDHTVLQKRREAEGFATSCLIVPLVARVA